jgi:NitT/TauT family transport system permease protein
MTLSGPDKSDGAVPLGLGPRGLLPNLYDVVIFILMAGIFVLLAHGAREMGAPLTKLDVAPVTLDPTNLPEYALRTTLRMFAAILVSLLFTFVVGTLAAKSRKAELIIVPALDILQSVPILWLSHLHGHFFLAALSRQPARRRMRGHLRDLHQPSLEHVKVARY